MRWSMTEAREKLAQLIRAAGKKPQTITKQGQPVAFVIDVEEYESFRRWDDARRKQTLPTALDELQAACVADDYTLEASPRTDRASSLAIP